MTAVPANARGVIALLPDACTSCMLCVRECPTWCIEIDSHAEQVSEPGARRPKSVSVLDEFRIDYGLCMYCGICIEVCPFDALEWRPDFDYSTADRAGLVQSTDQLAAWSDDSNSNSTTSPATSNPSRS
jgi:NADH-quinone oxidoreductase subunit I